MEKKVTKEDIVYIFSNGQGDANALCREIKRRELCVTKVVAFVRSLTDEETWEFAKMYNRVPNHRKKIKRSKVIEFRETMAHIIEDLLKPVW